MNHFHASQVRPEMDSKGNIRLYNGSDEAIEPGMEILLNYGDFPNEKLLLVYGFFFFFSDDWSLNVVAIYSNVPSQMQAFHHRITSFATSYEASYSVMVAVSETYINK